ncbi:VOC family protein [Vibrio navarrensis]|uniref:VOC family protein n=1 Tax=Vibrio navarrensis TaxID=29495 RepID=UPI00068AFB18|nr:VOC family protein [Vibrio navarrensis]
MANVRLAHIALNCQDPIATERFYSQFFGFERTRVYDPGENQVVMIKLGECYLELFRASEPRPMAPPLLAYAIFALKWRIWTRYSSNWGKRRRSLSVLWI